MSEAGSAFYEASARLFQHEFPSDNARRAGGAEWPEQQWQRLEDMGLPDALIPEHAGGYGLALSEAFGLIRLVGYHAAPLPLAETMIANWLMAVTGLTRVAGPLSIAPVTAERLSLTPSDAGWALQGSVSRVPWARHAKAVLVLAQTQTQNSSQNYLCVLSPQDFKLSHDINLAGEPRDTLHIDAVLQTGAVAPSPSALGQLELSSLGAASRCLMIAGATDRILEMSVSYANDRRQFGRPIGKFQAVQQNLAVLAAHTAAASAAADLAADAVSLAPALLAIGAAKVRAGEAAGAAAGIAHQVHGAIGFTEEHSLHRYTKRLWAWRDEFGREAEWNQRVGHEVAAAGADRLWALIASV